MTDDQKIKHEGSDTAPFSKLVLNEEEQDILSGKKGKTLQKVMKTVVLYAEACGATKLVPVEGPPHFVICTPSPAIGPSLEMLDELIEAGLMTTMPFTVDPRPVDFDNLMCTTAQKKVFMDVHKDQTAFEERLAKLGLRDSRAFTCTCYLPEVGNRPIRGTVLAWSESSAVIFANSVLGARTHRNGAIIDLLCNILGKTPLFGLLEDDGRRARWLVEIDTSILPNPQLLGGAIGRTVGEEVPYLVGLDKFLGNELSAEAEDFFKDMGATCAAIGAVGLFHVENLTPEARDQGRKLLFENHCRYFIDDRELQRVRQSYDVLWKTAAAVPRRCLIGCPHLSLRQLHWWTERIHDVLREKGKKEVSMETVLFAAPDVMHEFQNDRSTYEKLMLTGVKLSAICAETFMTNPLVAEEPVITNSNKLRAYTTARFFIDDEILDIISDGELKGNCAYDQNI
ncbi:MAG: DUF521 domain-containing protein [Candidatus Aminicenantes bacterium]|nr:DUF521 domain-containing protein [Candidatus Aminicenantes bacterium]